MWIQLVTKRAIDVRGKTIHYEPGDWVDVGKHLALKLIDEGVARIPDDDRYVDALRVENTAIISDDPKAAENHFSSFVDSVEFIEGIPMIARSFNIYWTPGLNIKPSLITAGVGLLRTWEIAIPVWDYDHLAVHLGTEEDRNYLKGVIRDLRALAFDHRLIFFRDCRNVERLLNIWRDECDKISDKRLSLLCAVYRVKPYILHLPMTWTQNYDKVD